MSANRQDNLLRYMVDSHSQRGVQHVVELDSYPSEHDCNGSCTCPHFTFRLEPFLQKGAPACNQLRCHHIKEARDRLVSDTIMAARKNTLSFSALRSPETVKKKLKKV